VSQPAEIVAPPPSAVPPQLLALVAPDVGMPRVAREGRARWPIAFAMACALALAGAQATRVNARTETLQELEMSGQLKDMSDRQIDEQAKGAERKFIVKSVAGAVFRPGLLFVAYLASLYLLSWFLRGRSKGGQMAAVAAASLLPGALRDLLAAGAALMHASLPTAGPSLVPTNATQLLSALGWAPMGAWARLGNALDLFSLWSALLFAFGLATAASLTRRRALLGALIAWGLWRLLFACAFHLGG